MCVLSPFRSLGNQLDVEQTIAALLNDGGIYPLEIEVKIRSNNGAISEAQLISSVAGIPSGPAVELGDSSLIASIITVSLKFMSDNQLASNTGGSVKNVLGLLMIFDGSGVVKTLSK